MQDSDPRRQLRHNLRGSFHSLRLCVQVIATETDPMEMLPWLEQVEQAADDCARWAEDLGRLPDAPGPAI